MLKTTNVQEVDVSIFEKIHLVANGCSLPPEDEFETKKKVFNEELEIFKAA